MELFGRVAHEQGAAVLIVTHDQRTLDVFDAIYQLEDGRLSSPGADAASLGAVEHAEACAST